MNSSAEPEVVGGLRRHRHEAPALEPLEAYRRLQDRGAILLDGMGAHPEARHAYVACSPALEVRLQDGTLGIRHEDGREEALDGPPIAALRRVTERFRFPVEEDGFTGGFAGWFGHEALHAIESGLPAPARKGPDAVLRLFRDVWRLDRQTGDAALWTADLPGEGGADARAQAILSDLRSRASTRDAGGPPPGGSWEPSLDRAAFEERVRRLQTLVRRGDHYQTNLATRWSAPCTADPADLFERLQGENPSPFMGLVEWDDIAIVSSSPEQLFAVEDGIIRSRPIAGTRPRDADPGRDAALERELLEDAKEQAEHTMLVDLVRNDIAKVSEPGTVRVAERMSVERYRHVMHLVSRVEGRVRAGTGFTDWLAALFPGGTITGAPKHRACRRIGELEPVPRGPYTGSMGFLSWSHQAHWNIMIRTLVLQDGRAHVHAGSGIVADSDAAREWDEAGHKARALLQAATGTAAGGSMARLGEVTRHGVWTPPAPRGQVDARLLVVDNYDSFTYNLVDYCTALGADVDVIRHDEDWQAAAQDATHILLSPGPGRPEMAGCCEEVVRESRVPVLGVCLGHQAMATATGGAVVEGEPVHGKPALIRHHGEGLLAGSPDPLAVTRYHSLVVDRTALPPEWVVDAWLPDGTVMAMHHARRPLWGLQFHPESICTDRGLEIIQRFLEV